MIPHRIAESFEVVTGNIADEGAERIVKSDNVAVNTFLGRRGDLGAEMNQLRDHGAEEGEIPACGEMSTHRRKNIPSMESRGDVLPDHPARIADFACRVQSVALDDRGDKAIIRQDEILASLGFDHDGPA